MTNGEGRPADDGPAIGQRWPDAYELFHNAQVDGHVPLLEEFSWRTSGGGQVEVVLGADEYGKPVPHVTVTEPIRLDSGVSVRRITSVIVEPDGSLEHLDVELLDDPSRPVAPSAGDERPVTVAEFRDLLTRSGPDAAAPAKAAAPARERGVGARAAGRSVPNADGSVDALAAARNSGGPAGTPGGEPARGAAAHP